MKRKMLEQRAYGCVLLLCSLVMFLMMRGEAPGNDCTALLFIAPLGFFLLLTKKFVLI